MEAFVVYILKSSIAVGIFYIGYIGLFQKSKTFTFNRIYLLAAFILSFIIPLITFVEVKYIHASSAGSSYITHTGFDPGSERLSISHSWRFSFVEGLYFLFAAGFLLILLAGYLRVFNITRRSTIYKLFNFKVHVTPIDVSPFSFFNKIVIGKGKMVSQNLRVIIEHEYIHVKERHSLDILLAELLYILQWFNPFAWLLKEAVKTNLEYITDHKIIQKYNATDYQLMMVSETHKQGLITIMPSLSGSQLKNRIAMMRKEPNKKYFFARQLFIFPLVALLVMGLSEKEVRTEIIQPIERSHPSTSAVSIEEILSKEMTNKAGISFSDVESIWERKPVREVTDLTIKKRLNEKTQDEIPVSDQIGLNNPEEVSYKSEILNVQLNHIDTVKSDEKPMVEGEHIRKEHEKFQIDPLNEPLYVVDGIITKHINQVSPDDIERIDVLKKESSMKLYGSAGRNGVVIISTKSKSISYQNDSVGTERTPPQEQFIVPEKWPQFPGGKDAYQEYIASNIRYPETAKEKGIQGTVYVSFRVTQKGKIRDVKLTRDIYPEIDEEAIRLVTSMPDWRPGTMNGEPVELSDITVPVRFELEEPVVKVSPYQQSRVVPGPLYFVDGEETGSIKDIDPEDIASVEVLKSPKATALYGQRGKDGVILIITKQSKINKPITSELALRKFFAQHVKYPVEAQKSGIQGTVSFVIDINKSNRVVTESGYKENEVYNLPDIVAVGHVLKDVPVDYTNTETSHLYNEIERIRKLLPEIAIPGFKSNLLKINVEFRLQTEE